MLFKFFTVASTSFVFNASALTLGARSKNLAMTPVEMEDLPDLINLLAQAHAEAVVDADVQALTYADTEVDSETLARALAEIETGADEGFLGNIGDQGISAVDQCTAYSSAWECNSSPAGCMYRDTAHECTKI